MKGGPGEEGAHCPAPHHSAPSGASRPPTWTMASLTSVYPLSLASGLFCPDIWDQAWLSHWLLGDFGVDSCGVKVGSVGSKARSLGFESQLHHLLVV